MKRLMTAAVTLCAVATFALDEPIYTITTDSTGCAYKDGLAPGIYFVKAVAEGNVVAVRKVVKR